MFIIDVLINQYRTYLQSKDTYFDKTNVKNVIYKQLHLFIFIYFCSKSGNQLCHFCSIGSFRFTIRLAGLARTASNFNDALDFGLGALDVGLVHVY